MSRLMPAAIALLFIIAACAPKAEVKPEAPAVEQPAPPEEELKLPAVNPQSKFFEEKKTAPPPEKKQEEQYVMLNFENADIETVIATVGEMLKINYIVTPGVSGKVTIQSHNKIPMSELFSTFQTLLEINGFTAVKYGSFYRIIPIDTAKQQPIPIEAGKTPSMPKDASFITQEVPLEFVKANDVANIVRNLMPKGTDIVVYEPSNMLIVTAPPSGMVKFLKLLETIDLPATDRDSIKTFVYNVENGEAKKLAELLKNIYIARKAAASTVKSVSPTPPAPSTVTAPSTPATARPAQKTQTGAGASVQEGLAGEIEGDVIIEAYEEINAILIKSSPRAYLSLLETLKKLDVQPKQVLIEVLIAEITLDDSTEMGIEWLLSTSVHALGKGINVVGGVNTGDINYDSSTGQFSSTTSSSGGGLNIIDSNRFSMFINAAASTGKVNVLASPHILALDNKEAKIEVADEVPVATSITTDSSSTSTSTSTVQFKSAGTILTVTPHINDKKQVTLKLVQEKSAPGTTYKIGGQDYQGFTTRKATTTAVVQDGHSLVLGGFIKEEKSTSRTGIPYLSDIPVLGYLFSTTKDTNTKTELILVITPHVIADADEADDLTKELKDKIMGLSEKALNFNKEKDEKGVKE